MELIGISLVLALALGGYFIYINKKTPPTDFGDSQKVLEEVEVLLAYGRTKQALALLEKSVAEGVPNENVMAKLHELRALG